MKILKERDWAKYIRSGHRLFFGSGAAVPTTLIRNFLKQVHQFHSLEAIHILTLGDTPWTLPEYEEHIKVNAFFLGAGTRDAVMRGQADYTPCFLSEIPSLFDDRIVSLDVAFIHVSPPDEHGYCSFGVSVDIVKSACRNARTVIAQVNPRMPRTFGDSFIHVSEIDACIEVDEAIIEHPPAPLDDVMLKIGKYCSLLIEDGATLQMGIGKIPDAVMHYLRDHNDLGIHTEMFSDGLLELYANGNISNRMKKVNPGKSITSFCFGTQKLYDFVNENPHIEFHPSEYTNQPMMIAKNPKAISINSAIEIDLSGQVVADSIGGRFYSGIGGQVDFIRGAGMSPGGRPIIALPSTAAKCTISRIVPRLREGSGVVTSRGDVHYVVTEYGIATLRGRSIRERTLELIQVAHPDFREQLLDEMRDATWVPGYQTHKPVKIDDFDGVDIRPLSIGKDPMFIRPLQASDQRRLQEFFYSHSEKTLLQRYRHVPKTMASDRAYRLVNVDQSIEPALCIFERQGPREIIHAVGRYYRESDECGEVAFVVDETMHGKGIGSILLRELILIATKRKLKSLVAYVRTDNIPMRTLLEKFNFECLPADEPGELVLKLEL